MYWTVSLEIQNSITEALTHNVTIFRDGAYKEVIKIK